MVVLIVSFIVSLTDFILKNHLKNNLFQSLPVIKDVFHITIVFNTGAAFGILNNKNCFLVCISVIFIIFLLIIISRDNEKNFLIKLSYGLILGGALSNLFDRILYGYVIDYLDFQIWPVFNLSDACITIGVSLIILQSIKQRKNEKRIPGN
ncbi:MAG: signal peptidase II [Candidatus Omnitrophica bacterium]|nr:signal peptidase II [Candidatus Omnitrophota bacterium]